MSCSYSVFTQIPFAPVLKFYSGYMVIPDVPAINVSVQMFPGKKISTTCIPRYAYPEE